MSEPDDNPMLRDMLDAIAEKIASFRVRFGTEELLQEDIARVLAASGIVFVREHHLSPDCRIDFYLPELLIGIECKVDGSSSDVSRQLIRYANQPSIHGLLLVTRRRSHELAVRELAGKPFRGVWIGASSL